MDDLISRQALCEYALNQKDKSVTPNDIMRFPSAQPEKRTEERTEMHGVCLDAIDRQATLDWLKNEWNGMITSLFDGIKALPPAQPNLQLTCNLASNDCISRQAAIDAHYEYCNKHPDASFPVWSLKILENLPSAQPDSKELSGTHKALDTVSRQAVIEAINKIFPADPMRDDYTQGITCGAALANIYVAQLPSAHPEIMKWIPCSERLPEGKQEVLVTEYGDTDMGRRFDGRWVDRYGDKMKDVTAWMEKPEPYREEGD